MEWGTVTPSLEEVRGLARDHNLIPVYRHDLADVETPVAAYWRLNGDGPGFLLESVEGGEHLGRFSFIGGPPRASITMRGGRATIETDDGIRTEAFEDPVAYLQSVLGDLRQAPTPGLPGRFSGGLVGYLAYEAAGYFEKLPSPGSDPLDLPDAVFFLVDNVVLFDHLLHRRTVIAHVRLEPGDEVETAYADAVGRLAEMVDRLDRADLPPGADYPGAGEAATGLGGEWNIGPAAFRDRVLRCKEYILAGDIFQVQVSRRLEVPMTAHPFYLYRVLRTVNPSPYMYYLRLPGHAGERRRGTAIVGTSPEILVRVEDGDVEYRPIAGTRRRGEDEARDAAMEAELLGSEKERAEHLMLVDLGRNDVGRFAEVGSVKVPELMFVERYSAVMHLVSRVTARLAEGRTSFDALRACFPAGTVTGAPKIRAMEIIAEMEPEARGVYAGAVGYIGFGGQPRHRDRHPHRGGQGPVRLRAGRRRRGGRLHPRGGAAGDGEQGRGAAPRGGAGARAGSLMAHPLVVIDNYDSFTYNLVQYLGELGESPVVLRNDAASIGEIAAMAPLGIVISPGPARRRRPASAPTWSASWAPSIPVLGVCLGHQCIGEAYGGRVVRAPRVMHGKLSSIEHAGAGVLEGLPNPFTATRYHSLVVDPGSLPADLEPTAWTEDTLPDGGVVRVLMGVRHREHPVEGVQFHPESIMTEAGHELLANFLDLCRRHAAVPA